MKQINEKEAIVGPVRLSYLKVFTPQKNEIKDGSPLEYSVMLLFPKANCEHQPDAEGEVKALRKLLNANVFAKWGEKPPVNLRNPIRDGDKEVDGNGEPKAPGYWFMSVSAQENYPPLLIDRARAKVTSGWHSGDWGKVQIGIFAYDKKGNKGVSAGLRAIQFLFKDESLGGGSPNADAFDVIEGATTTQHGNTPEEYDPFSDE